MPTNGAAECEIPDGFEESFQVRYSHGYGKETGTITLTAPSGRKMTYSGQWGNGSSSTSDCTCSIKEGNSYICYDQSANRTFSEKTTAGNILTAICYHNGICGSLILNVKMNADPIRVSNIEKIYPYTGNAVSVVPTVHDVDNDTTLTAGTDYDVTFSPAEVKDKGVYAITISGKGGYSFTRTFNFLVATLDYIDENGATQTKTQGELTILTTRDSLPAALTGWYFVADNISFNDGVTVNGEAHLILADGTTMSANCIHVNSGNTLNIYGQTDGTGKLIATPGGLITYDACIGASEGSDCGTIVINGGDISAQTTAKNGGAGIGASYSCGVIIINGGKVTAKGYGYKKDIGGGSGSVTINGGQITANANGIGGSTVSLGWKDASTDFIQSPSYAGAVSFQEGKPFILDDGTNLDATADNIGGKKIVPKHDEISYNLDNAAIDGIAEYYAPNDEGVSIQYSVIYVGNVTLQEGVDYTATITDSDNRTVDAVKTPGVYTLTITGAGSYTGTKTSTIIVYGYKETLGGYEFSTSGDEEGLYYLVDSEEALRAIATYVNSGNNAYGKRFKQTQNISMTGGDFRPIGEYSVFNGTYDGGNFHISNLTVAKEYGYLGLFGLIGNADCGTTVKNVVLVSPTMTTTDPNNTAASYVTALIG